MFLDQVTNQLEKKVQKEILTESSAPIPQNPRQNLESKIESLLRSIQNLSEKKVRIEFELKMQKRALARKREELKRVNKTSQARAKISLEQFSNFDLEEKELERKRTQKLLQESARILEE